MKNVLFDEAAKEFLLEAFDCGIDDENYVVNRKMGARVQIADGSELTLDNFGALKKGSLKFIEADLGSLLSVIDDI